MIICDLCGPKKSPLVQIIGGLCGRCRHNNKPRRTSSECIRLWRARRGGKSIIWVAFDKKGDVASVHTKEDYALEVSNIVRPFRLNKRP